MNSGSTPSSSVRQFAVYHKFSAALHDPCSTWIVLDGFQVTKDSIKEYVSNVVDMKSSLPFELHTLLIDRALASWRPYSMHLHARVQQIVSFFMPNVCIQA